MRWTYIISLLVILVSCKPSPSYDPFDDLIDVSVSDLLDKGWLKPSGTQCGFAEIVEPNGRLRLYYQVYDEDLSFVTNSSYLPPSVVAKGFTYYVDTIALRENDNLRNQSFVDSVMALPFDTMLLNTALNPFNYRISQLYRDSLRLVRYDRTDSTTVDFDFYPAPEDNYIHRVISFYKARTNE